MLKTFSQEKDDWIENFRTKFVTQATISGATQSTNEPDFSQVLDSNKWEAERAQILRNWSEETDVLTMVILTAYC